MSKKTITCIIFMLLFSLYNMTADSNNSKKCYYKGTIGKNNIQMELTFAEKKISGYYFYDFDGRYITLNGDNSFILTESFENKNTGIFKADLQDKNSIYKLIEIKGEWTNPKGSVKIPFALKKVADYILKKDNKYDVSILYPQFSNEYSLFNKAAEDIEKNFQNDLETCKESEETPYSNWNYKIEYFSGNLICIGVFNESYFGGAHPNDGMYSLIYQVKNSNLIPVKLEDCIKPDNEEKLKELCEKYIIYKNEEIENAGDYIEVNLPIIHGNGLEFISPSYRTGPMNSGLLNALIPYKELKDIIKNNGPLKDFIK